MNVTCTVVSTGVVRDSRQVAAVEVTCTRCGVCMASRTTSAGSVRRVFATLRQVCPRGETNWYRSHDESAERTDELPYGGRS